MKIICRNGKLDSYLDGELFNKALRNTLTKPMRGGCDLRIYVPGQVILKIHTAGYRLLK
jgi:hypothetical protein